MSNKKSSRSWCLTQSCEKMSQEELQNALSEYVYIAQREKGKQGGEEGYEHFQIYIENPTPIRFETLKNKLPNAHIEPRRGTKQQAYDYVTKSETKIGENFGNGVIDLTEKQGKRSDIEEVMAMVYEGKSDSEIEELYPVAMFRYEKAIHQTRQRFLEKKFGNVFRKLDVMYIYGDAGEGKTRFVMEKHGYGNVYRVTNWDNPFDCYNGESVLMFEEFRSSLKIERMLNYLDGYPLVLPARYRDRVACYTSVYIVSNIPLEQQYPVIQERQPETWNAFLRRIHSVWHFGFTDTPKDRELLYPIVRPSKLQLTEVFDDLGF